MANTKTKKRSVGTGAKAEAESAGGKADLAECATMLRLFPNRKSETHFYGAQTGDVPDGWSCRKHLHHMMFELNLVLAGTQIAEVGGTAYRQDIDHLIFIPPMMPHAYRADGPLSFFVMHVQVDDPVFLNDLNRAKLPLLAPDHELNRLLLPEVRNLMRLAGDESSSKTKIFRGVYGIMDILESYLAEHDDDVPEEDQLALLIAQEIESLVAERDDEAISAGWMEALADRTGFSRRHCYRVFREAYGLSPREYLAVLRQQEAMHLLLGGDRSVEEVARRIGYGNAQSFIRQFVKWTGVTPGAFRKHRGGETVYLAPLELQ